MNQRHLRGAAVAVTAAAFVSLAVVVPASADNGTDTSALRQAVTVEGILAHERPSRPSPTPTATRGPLAPPATTRPAPTSRICSSEAGYLVHRQSFTYEQFILNSSAMQQTAPSPTVYVEDEQFAAMDYSGSGDVTTAVQAVDINLAGDRASTSGCEAADFAGFTPGNIALIQRGTCFFRVKVDNAAAAGAAAVIVFNQGNVDPNDDRLGVVFGTLDPPVAAIPAVGTTFAIGEALATTTGLVMRVAVDATLKSTTTFNVLADTPSGRADRTVLVGAHLDSVAEGPGINDNGSGSAAILETALQMAELGIEPTNRVRFAFWGGEEDGLIGSDFYVSQLDARSLKQHAVNLNFDMVGSPNFVRFVYDGDGSAFGVTGPTGSARVEQVFLDYFASQGLATEPTEFDGRSDYFAFINNGIPAGGLFTGAEGIKTAAEAADLRRHGGPAYDPCYHQACDDIDNLSNTALDQMSDAIAHATLTFASTTSAINGTAKGGSGSTVDLAMKGNRAIK